MWCGGRGQHHGWRTGDSVTLNQGGGAEGGARSRKRESGVGGGGMKENGYAKVEGPKVSRVMHTICLTLGRETMASKRKAPEPADDDQAAELAQREKRKEKSFLSIGQHSSISRRHVELVYDFHKRRWALLCLGRNGVYVDNVFVNQVPLTPTLVAAACLAYVAPLLSRWTAAVFNFWDGSLRMAA